MYIQIEPDDKLDRVDVDFGPDNPNWQQQTGYNAAYLRIMHNSMMDRLLSRGFLFLNDVLDMLTLPRTVEGQVLGWLSSEINGPLWNTSSDKDEEVIHIQFLLHGVIWTHFVK